MASLRDMADEQIVGLANGVLGALRAQHGPTGKLHGNPTDAVRAALENIGEDVTLAEDVADMLVATGFLFQADPSMN